MCACMVCICELDEHMWESEGDFSPIRTWNHKFHIPGDKVRVCPPSKTHVEPSKISIFITYIMHMKCNCIDLNTWRLVGLLYIN